MQALTKETLKNNVANNFRYARKELGMTGREMGELLGLTQKAIDAIENRKTATPIQVYKLSRLISVSMETIYTTELNNQNQ